MQKGVHGRFMDHSTSVREAAVELVGKFILIRPELTSQYYEMLSARILVRYDIVYIIYIRPCLIKNPGAQKNALLDSHIYPEGSNFIRPPIILSGVRNKTVVAVGFSEDRTNTCSWYWEKLFV